MFYSETDSTDPCYNLAFEEYILCNRTENEWLLLWQNCNTVVVGLNQNTLEEIDPDFTRKHGLFVVRRTTGGGAVYHDLGNLNYSFITDAGETSEMPGTVFTSAVCAALSTMGISAEASGRNDIAVNGKKISGTAQRIYRGRLLHHGTLLFKTDISMMERALRTDTQKYSSKSTKSLRSRVANICDFLQEGTSIEDFKKNLRDALTAGQFDRVCLSSEEQEEVKRLADSKYRMWEWNYGASPPFTVKKSARYNGGRLEIFVDVRKGLIHNLRFFGDYMARIPADPLAAALFGRKYDFDEVASVLEVFPIAEMFGSICQKEILDLMFS